MTLVIVLVAMINPSLEYMSKEEQKNALHQQWKGVYRAIELLDEMRQKEKSHEAFVTLCYASSVLCRELHRLCEESDKVR
jgi:siroheme synthase (precorrin-2 oxidase/ferrochelatase)